MYKALWRLLSFIYYDYIFGNKKIHKVLKSFINVIVLIVKLLSIWSCLDRQYNLQISITTKFLDHWLDYVHWYVNLIYTHLNRWHGCHGSWVT